MNDIRDLILKRVEEIRNSFGSDLFDKKGWFKYQTTEKEYIIKDWSILSDNELVKQFEILIMRAYRQR